MKHNEFHTKKNKLHVETIRSNYMYIISNCDN